MILDVLAGLAGAAALAVAVFLPVRLDATVREAALAASLAALISVPLAAALGPGALLAIGLAALATMLPAVIPREGLPMVLSLALLALAAWISAGIGLAGLVALAWMLPESWRAGAAWLVAGALLVAVPAALGAGSPVARGVFVTLGGALALAGRRALRHAAPGPGARRATLHLIASLPAFSLVVLLVASSRAFPLPPDALWSALALAAAALAGAALAGLALLGFLTIASTANGLRPPLVGWSAACALGVPLLGAASFLLLIPVAVIALAIGTSAVAHGDAQRRAPARA